MSDHDKRLSSDYYLWHIAFAVAKRGTCNRFRGGCVVARNGVLIATGYNGSAPGEGHCDDPEVGHEYTRFAPGTMSESKGFEPTDSSTVHCTRTIHAEVNAIVSAAYLGVSIRGCSWYTTGVPCQRCAQIISRLEPKALFLCISQGGVDDDKKELVEWWRTRQRKCLVDGRLHVRSLEELIESGVANADS